MWHCKYFAYCPYQLYHARCLSPYRQGNFIDAFPPLQPFLTIKLKTFLCEHGAHCSRINVTDLLPFHFTVTDAHSRLSRNVSSYGPKVLAPQVQICAWSPPHPSVPPAAAHFLNEPVQRTETLADLSTRHDQRCR